MKKLRLASKIIKILFKDRVYYPGRLIADTAITSVRCGILLLLYSYVFHLKGGTIHETTFLISAWSMFFYFLFGTLYLRHISRMIIQDVQSGNVEILLNKPISYLFYRMWWQVGSGFYSFFILILFGVMVLGLLVGFPSSMMTWIFFPTFLLVIIFGCILSLFLYTIIGLFAFWIEDANPIFWIVDKSVMILGGSYLPITLFPDLMYKVAFYSPFGATQFITHTVLESWQKNWYQFFGIQLFWILIFGGIVYFMFERAKKKISVNGG